MNDGYLMLWNQDDGIEVLHLNQQFKQTKIDLQLNNTNDLRIKTILTGTNMNFVGILIENNQMRETLVTWDIAKNVQVDQFDIRATPGQYKVLWDGQGIPYIVYRDGNVLFTG